MLAPPNFRCLIAKSSAPFPVRKQWSVGRRGEEALTRTLHSLPARSLVPTVAFLLTLPLWTSLRLSLLSDSVHSSCIRVINSRRAVTSEHLVIPVQQKIDQGVISFAVASWRSSALRDTLWTVTLFPLIVEE